MDYSNECSLVRDRAVVAAREEIRLFCRILGYPNNDLNHLIGDDPHGIVDMQEGYRYFNMTDIHVVLKEYERWMEIYKTNEELRKAVDEWYYYCIDWHNKHSLEEPRWIRVEERLPELDSTQHTTKKNMSVAVVCWDENIQCDSLGQMYSPMICKYDYERKDWLHVELGYYENEVELGAQITHWMYIQIPSQEAERSKGCPNLRSWLAGCPVEGLRDATSEWQTKREKDLQAAHQRVEECKQALEDAIKEEVKLNKF